MTRNTSAIGARPQTLCVLAFMSCLLSGQALAQTKPTPNWGATDIQVNPQTQPNFRKNTPEVIPGTQLQISPGLKAINDKYKSLGGPGGVLGKPRGVIADSANGGKFAWYFQGAIYWHPTTGAHVVMGQIAAKWQNLGLEKGVLGYPTSDEIPQYGGRMGNFQRGAIFWHPERGALAVSGRIYDFWQKDRQCGEFPVTDEMDGPLEDGAKTRTQKFHSAQITWNSRTDRIHETSRCK